RDSGRRAFPKDRSGGAGTLKLIEPFGTPSRYHGIPQLHRGLASGRWTEYGTKKPWARPTIEHDERHPDILAGFRHRLGHVSLNHLVPCLVIGSGGESRR